MLGHGANPLYAYEYDGQTDGRNKEGLNGTKAMYDLIKEANDKMRKSGIDDQVRIMTTIGWLLFWSDGFLHCFIKQKDNSIWLLMVTVCPPENMKSSNLYIHVLTMGRHDADHTPVIEHYMKDAARLIKGFKYYCGHSRKNWRQFRFLFLVGMQTALNVKVLLTPGGRVPMVRSLSGLRMYPTTACLHAGSAMSPW